MHLTPYPSLPFASPSGRSLPCASPPEVNHPERAAGIKRVTPSAGAANSHLQRVSVMLASQLNALVEQERLQENSVARLDECLFNHVNGRPCAPRPSSRDWPRELRLRLGLPWSLLLLQLRGTEPVTCAVTTSATPVLRQSRVQCVLMILEYDYDRRQAAWPGER
jgi:hypothetical protein